MSNKIENPFTYSSEPELNIIFDKLVSLKTRVEGQLAKAERMAGLGDNARFMPVENVKIILPSLKSIREPNGEFRYNVKIPLDRVEAKAREYIATARTQIAEVEARNVTAIEHNKMLCQQITDLMARIGIPMSYTTYELPSPRHKNRKTITHSAGFLGDLSRSTPKSNTMSAKIQVDDYERNLPRYITSWQAEETKVKTESDARAIDTYISQRPGIVALLSKAADIDLLTRLSQCVPGTKMATIKDAIQEAIDIVLGKNKYLRLAYYLHQNRNDWNDGCSFAEQGLNGFIVENETDQEIQDELQELIDNWDGDGRVFRDCTWNYSTLYRMAEKEGLIDHIVQLQQLSALLD